MLARQGAVPDGALSGLTRDDTVEKPAEAGGETPPPTNIRKEMPPTPESAPGSGRRAPIDTPMATAETLISRRMESGQEEVMEIETPSPAPSVAAPAPPSTPTPPVQPAGQPQSSREPAGQVYSQGGPPTPVTLVQQPAPSSGRTLAVAILVGIVAALSILLAYQVFKNDSVPAQQAAKQAEGAGGQASAAQPGVKTGRAETGKPETSALSPPDSRPAESTRQEAPTIPPEAAATSPQDVTSQEVSTAREVREEDVVSPAETGAGLNAHAGLEPPPADDKAPAVGKSGPEEGPDQTRRKEKRWTGGETEKRRPVDKGSRKRTGGAKKVPDGGEADRKSPAGDASKEGQSKAGAAPDEKGKNELPEESGAHAPPVPEKKDHEPDEPPPREEDPEEKESSILESD